MTIPQATEREVSVEGRPYPVIEAGQGPLVVCLHGFPDNNESFKYQIGPLVEAGYRVVCPMLPGYVADPQPSARMTPVRARDEVIALIEVLLAENSQEKCHLVGHDWGRSLPFSWPTSGPTC